MSTFITLVIGFIVSVTLMVTGTIAYQMTGVEMFGIAVAFGLAIGGASTLVAYVHYCLNPS